MNPAVIKLARLFIAWLASIYRKCCMQPCHLTCPAQPSPAQAPAPTSRTGPAPAAGYPPTSSGTGTSRVSESSAHDAFNGSGGSSTCAITGSASPPADPLTPSDPASSYQTRCRPPPGTSDCPAQLCRSCYGTCACPPRGATLLQWRWGGIRGEPLGQRGGQQLAGSCPGMGFAMRGGGPRLGWRPVRKRA